MPAAQPVATPAPAPEPMPATAPLPAPEPTSVTAPLPAPEPVPVPQPPPAAAVAPRAAGAIWEPGVLARTWRELGYLFLVFLLGPLAFAYVVTTVALVPSVAVTVVGLFVCGWLVLGGRLWGGVFRAMARGMLGVDVARPAPPVARRGFWRYLGGLLGDVAGWRALAFAFLSFPLGTVAFTTSFSLLATSLGAMTHWYWYRWLPVQPAADGTLHRGAQLGPDFFVDTPARQALLALLGLVLLLVWQKVTIGFAHLFRLLTAALLGPTRADAAPWWTVPAPAVARRGRPDDELTAALEGLAALCPLPVTVDVDVPVPPDPGVVATAYVAVAELLTNVVRHSGASGAYVRADAADGALTVRVCDDGRGGVRVAGPGATAGLAVLARRAEAAGGWLVVDSPAGGPTVVGVVLPLVARP